ncbi:MAG: MoaD/ThiS family protein [Dehalococcoidia bacterium]
MPTVIIPSLLRGLTGGQRQVQVRGATLRQVIDNLSDTYPGVRERILDIEMGRVQPSLSLAVNGEVTQIGLLQPVSEDSEIQILPAISGGSAGAIPSSDSRR